MLGGSLLPENEPHNYSFYERVHKDGKVQKLVLAPEYDHSISVTSYHLMLLSMTNPTRFVFALSFRCHMRMMLTVAS
ncbi:hypothetical protein NITHO_460012 [Nitrolancea hollandica Lb]|uniref:Uncharacterized protein n=1 Tax=Nitrolancea hollandica Lb TaxID=1129897 RepID=I4EKG4_9BACT|nr:hypothetical protein NITHO_460012 [Nitrolancea hollandica Lb]